MNWCLNVSLRRVWLLAGAMLCVAVLVCGAPAIKAWAQGVDSAIVLDEAGFGVVKNDNLPAQAAADYTVTLAGGDNLAIDLQPETDAVQVAGVQGPDGPETLNDLIPGAYNVRALSSGTYSISVKNTGDKAAGFALRVLVTHGPVPTETIATLEGESGSLTVAPGQAFQVALPMHERAPSEWSLAMSSTDVVAQDGDPATLIFGTMPGAESQAIYTFKAIAVGEVDLSFAQQGDAAQEKPRVLKVTVQQSAAPTSAEPAPDSTITAALGSTILVPLPGNPSTGYVWQLEIGDPAVAKAEGEMTYTPAANLAGAPGFETFHIKAVGTGGTTLTFKEVRPWEKDAEPAQIMTLTVKVIEEANALAESLVKRYLDAVQAADKQGLKAMLAPAFQVVRSNGATDDAVTYLDHLPVIEQYTLDKVNATRDGSLLVVTYQATVDSTKDGAADYGKPAPRMTVFQQVNGEWKVLAHANLTPLQ